MKLNINIYLLNYINILHFCLYIYVCIIVFSFVYSIFLCYLMGMGVVVCFAYLPRVAFYLDSCRVWCLDGLFLLFFWVGLF